VRFSLDTNVLVYAADPNAGPKLAVAQQIILRAAPRDCLLTLQSLQEFYSATVSKRRLLPLAARTAVEQFIATFRRPPAAVSTSSLRLAMTVAGQKRFAFWDALLLASAGEAGCEAVISEDMHPGAMLGPVRVVPAFDTAGNISPEADALLA